jgi:outer membrane PBP1 activator LpoA protein
MAESKTPQQDVLTDIESHTPETLHPILEAAFTYRKQLIITVSVIVAVAAVYAGATAYTKRAITSSQADLGAILAQAKGADKVAQLEQMVNDAHGAVKPAVILALAEASMDDGEFAKAAEYWGQVADKADGDTRFAAQLGQAKAMLFAGKAAEALAALKGLAAEASEGYEIPLTRQIAVAAEAAGEKGEALAAYKKLAEKNVSDKPFVDYKISQLEAE